MYIAETYSEAVKMLKGDYVVRAIQRHNMDRALIFCRTKLDCDNLENYLNQVGQGMLILFQLQRPKKYQTGLLHKEKCRNLVASVALYIWVASVRSQSLRFRILGCYQKGCYWEGPKFEDVFQQVLIHDYVLCPLRDSF